MRILLLFLLTLGMPAAADPDRALQLAQQSRQAAKAGDLQQALQLTQSALALLEEAQKRGAGNDRMRAFVEDDRAAYLMKSGRLQEALQTSTRAVQRIARAAGEDSASYGLLAVNLGVIQVACGDVQAGLQTMLAAYPRLAKASGDRRARAALSIARASALKSDHDSALEWTGRALTAGPGGAVAEDAAAERVQALLQTRQLSRARLEYAQLMQAGRLSASSATHIAANIAFHESRLIDAEELFQQLLDTHPEFAENPAVLSRIGTIQILTGRLLEAQRTFRRVLAHARGTGLPTDHPLVGRTLHALAITYKDLSEYEEAELLYQQALQALGASLGPDSEAVARSRLEYSMLLSQRGQGVAAQKQARAAIRALASLDRQVPLGLAHSALGFALKQSGEPKPALQQFDTALGLLEQSGGPQSPDLPPGLIASAELQHQLGNGAAAMATVERAIEIQNRIGAFSLAGVARALTTKAQLQAAKHPQQALQTANTALEVVARELGRTSDQRYLATLAELRVVFERYLRVAASFRGDATVARNMLQAAQYPKLTTVAATISQVAARTSGVDARLAELLQQRQQLARQIEAAQQRFEKAVGSGREQNPPDRVKELVQSLQEVSAEIRGSYPAFAEQVFPRPVAAAAVQAELGADEAALTVLTTAGATYLFLLRPDALYVAVSAHTRAQVDQLVAQVRRSIRFDADGGLPEFAAGAAHQLYQVLLAPLQSRLAGVNHLVYVPDSGLVSLPLGLLLRSPAGPSAEVPPAGGVPHAGGLDFVQKQLAISTLPSLSSFVALRTSAPVQQSSGQLLGIGDPVLGAEAQTGVTRALPGVVSVDVHANLSPLPATRLEIETISRSFAEKTLLYQNAATEAALYGMADLRRFSVIVFATHGLLRDDEMGVHEPALILTRDAEHDGFLSASEISSLSLNADWVVLSACNTGAPDGSPRAPGLSGLARAFFFAGARGLLVSHWDVNSSAAVHITTSTIALNRGSEQMSKARALQVTLNRFIDGELGEVGRHPGYWAPFVFVGDGST